MVAQKGRIPAPKAGWVQNASLLEPPKASAEVLDDIFPTAAGARMRRGRSLHATITGAAVQVMVWNGATSKMFASDATNVYEISSPADAAVAPTADLTGLTSGDWSAINFGTSGGSFLWMCNGADSARHYNGTTWATPTITGVTSSNLSQCWAHGSRIFAIEAGTLSAWYLPADSIAGAMTELPLRTVFSSGGSLLFGTTWSLDSGEGLDDVCVFVTDQGEIAVYQGQDPDTSWSRIGTYEIAKPLSKHAFFKAGGDVAIATEEGIVSLAAAVQQDRTAISRSAITYPIEDAWREAVTLRDASHAFNATLWHSERMLLVSVPDAYDGTSQAFVCNSRTGAWCRFTGFDVQCSVVFNDRLYFGTSDGQVFAAETSGSDNGSPYTTRWLPKFMPMGTVVSLNAARVVYRGTVDTEPQLDGAQGFSTSVPSSPAPATDESSNVWGTALWGSAVWGEGATRVAKSEWKVVYALGDEISIWFQAGSNRTTAPDNEIIGIDFLYEKGLPM